MAEFGEPAPYRPPYALTLDMLDALVVPGAIHVQSISRDAVALYRGDHVEVFSLDIPRDPEVMIDLVRRLAAAYGQALSLLISAHLRDPHAAERASEWMRNPTRPSPPPC